MTESLLTTAPSASAKHPSLYQLNTRVWLTEISGRLGRRATLDDVTDAELDRLASIGFDWIWLLSVWTTGPKGKTISRTHAGWQTEFQHTLADLHEADIGGSGFAIAAYEVSPDIGGRECLERFRQRLRQRGLKLMLDFVPNHMGPDHPWVSSNPEYFIHGTTADLDRQPQNFTRLDTAQGPVVFAYGRDPYFDGWPDTMQLDYSNPDTIAAMQQELTRIAGQCDGVRCDMAMLVLPQVFKKTWGRKGLPFWSDAIRKTRETTPGFCFMAEVYWDLEWELQQLGFDYTYDKRLYDRLHQGKALPVVQHLFADKEFQLKSVRFLENHDEARAATAFQWPVHQAAAVITFTVPGMRFFHQGQLEGRRIRISPHLVRGPEEQPDKAVIDFYTKLLRVVHQPALKEGSWNLLHCREAWAENPTHEAFIAYCWISTSGEHVLVTVNFADHQSQCYVSLPFPELGGRMRRLTDLVSNVMYDREGDELLSKGLYLDMGPWQYHVFRIDEAPVATSQDISATSD
jgi:glycosidase